MILCARVLVGTLAFIGRRFRFDTRGNVATIFAVASMGLLVATGAGMDLARAYFARQKLSEVATLTCQFAMRPSAVNAGAAAYYAANVNQFASNELTTQNWPANALPTGGPSGTSSTYFTATGAGVGNGTQEPTGVAELWYNMPTAFMKIVAVNQITVHAVMNCQPPSQATPTTIGALVVNEGFETGKSSYYFTNPAGQTGALSSPLNTFPSTAGYQGDNGNQFYLMGYCMEIDQAGVISASDPQGTHSAELDCDNGSGSAGNSSITTKAYLPAGYYELRYNYRSRVDYPNYDPTYICGSTASDLSWANDTDGSTYGTRTNEINVYFDQSVNGAAPPLHSTLDGSQQLAGGNLIDMCIYGPNWIERSVKIKVTTTGYYWLTFAADGHNDSFGGQLDNIRLCVEQCISGSGESLDNFPTSWTSNLVLFEDGFDSPTYTAGSAPSMAYNGNLASSLGTTVSSCASAAPTGWPCQSATGWATAPYNQVNYYLKGSSQGAQYIAIDGNNSNNSNATTTNRLISRPFLLVPGYYGISYYYIANVNFSSLSGIYCTAAPSSGNIYASSYGNYSGQARYASGTISTDLTTNIMGAFMSHGQLVSTPNVAGAPWAVSADTTYAAPSLGAATSYTNPNGTVSASPTSAPDAVSWPSYNASVNNPVIDTCGYAAGYAPQQRSVSVKITKAAVYWLTFSSNGGIADGYGAGIDDVKLTVLGSPICPARRRPRSSRSRRRRRPTVRTTRTAALSPASTSLPIPSRRRPPINEVDRTHLAQARRAADRRSRIVGGGIRARLRPAALHHAGHPASRHLLHDAGRARFRRQFRGRCAQQHVPVADDPDDAVRGHAEKRDRHEGGRPHQHEHPRGRSTAVFQYDPERGDDRQQRTEHRLGRDLLVPIELRRDHPCPARAIAGHQLRTILRDGAQGEVRGAGPAAGAMTGLLSRFTHDRRATSALEFSFVLPVMLTLIAGMVEFGRWFQAYDGVNRLAARYAAVYSDCNDNPNNLQTSPQACNTELTQYWPPAAIANIAPQLSNGTASIRMFEVQYSSAGVATIIYSYPPNATFTTAETAAATTTIYTAGTQQTGVVVTVQYTYAAVFFPRLFQSLSPNATLNLTYTVAQRKT